MPVAELSDPASVGRGLGYERRGAGDPLLLITGMAGHHGMWGEPFLTALAEQADVITFEHRGIGASADVPGPMTIEALAADARRLLDALDIDRADVLGVSMGGMVAQELALGEPQRVRSLVLGCSYAGGAGSSLLAPGPLRMFEAANSGVLETAVRTAYEVNLSPAFRAGGAVDGASDGFDAQARYAEFRAASLSVPVRVPVILRQAQAALGHDTSARLPALSTPTLVVHGTADEMVLYSNAEYLAVLIAGARLHTFVDVGHLFWWEEPARSAELVLSHRERGRTSGRGRTGR